MHIRLESSANDPFFSNSSSRKTTTNIGRTMTSMEALDKETTSGNGEKAAKNKVGSTKSTHSLSRQKRVLSTDDLNINLEEQQGRSSTSSAQSIVGLSQGSSAYSSSPVGDFPHTIMLEKGSVLRRATWFLSHAGRTEDSEVEKPRGLYSVGRTIQRTGSQLRKTRLFHLFYILVLPIYTVIGAWIFKTLDGEHDDRLIAEYKYRCDLDREETLSKIRFQCSTEVNCFDIMRDYLDAVEQCYKNWHKSNRTITHSMNEFTNALVYAFSVYTTIGYGNMAADTIQCRVATIIYGAFGIPLFFAFVKEEGNLFRNLFISLYNKLGEWRKKNCRCPYKESPERKRKLPMSEQAIPRDGNPSTETNQQPIIIISELQQSKNAYLTRNCSTGSLLGQSRKTLLDEQRRVFIAGVLFFIFYILLSSLLFSVTTEFDYFTSVYFLFNSVALIGFGDVFPRDSKTILINAVFIVFGVVLFSMCYFILQEEIRNKAFEASHRARISISKYSNTILHHASRGAWSRRNSPLLESSPEGAFERLRKRRQSAPALTLTVPSRNSFKEI